MPFGPDFTLATRGWTHRVGHKIPNGMLVSQFALTFGVWTGLDVRYGSFSEVSDQSERSAIRPGADILSPMKRGCLVPQSLGKDLKDRMVKVQATLIAGWDWT